MKRSNWNVPGILRGGGQKVLRGASGTKDLPADSRKRARAGVGLVRRRSGPRILPERVGTKKACGGRRRRRGVHYRWAPAGR